LVGTALLAIGGESLLSRNGSLETFRSFLRLKIIWAIGAILAIILGIGSGGQPQAWIFMGIFCIFLIVWIFYHIKINHN
jgi:hypothetical protein